MQTITIEFPHSLFASPTPESVEEQVILHGGKLVHEHATLVRLDDGDGRRWQHGHPKSDTVKLFARYDDVDSDLMQTHEEFEEKLLKTMDLVWCAQRMWVRFPSGDELVIKHH
jgi:hypothetical protein